MTDAENLAALLVELKDFCAVYGPPDRLKGWARIPDWAVLSKRPADGFKREDIPK